MITCRSGESRPCSSSGKGHRRSRSEARCPPSADCTRPVYASVQTVLHILHDGDDVYSETVVHYRKMQDMTLLKHAQQGKAYIALDLETTGLSCFDHEILEIGAVKVENGKVINRFSQLVKPQESIPPAITQLTGITPDMVESCPAIAAVLPEMAAIPAKTCTAPACNN